jgi:RNA polymerase sigma-70 factor (ECF subfamily)
VTRFRLVVNQGPPDQSRWFTEEVQAHEPALRAYLHARFPLLADQDDLVQESYLRLLKARAAGKIRHARAFLFTTARNAALDFFRRRRTAAAEPITDFTASRVLEDSPPLVEIVTQQQELEVLAEAVEALPERCRQVVLLRYFDGLAYKEIAARLGISPETVKVHLAAGMRRCGEYFRRRGLLKTGRAAEEVCRG